MIDFCREHDIRFEICGKVIVATSDAELSRLKALHQRGRDNHIDCELIDRNQLRALEPHVEGVAGLHVRDTGIVDYVQVCEVLHTTIVAARATVHLNQKVMAIEHERQGFHIITANRSFRTRRLINCAGLYSDRIARLVDGEQIGRARDLQIIPFRGEYFKLKPWAQHLCKHLIYPVPDPRFPFLGVHFTRMVDGSIECGPNAVLAMGRESYHKTDIHLKETLECLMFPGFTRLSARHWRMGLGELHRSWSKSAFVKNLQKLIPAIEADAIEPAPAGIRAQAVGRSGKLVDDFVIRRSGNSIHVLNAPSPAATAALSIGKMIAGEALNPKFADGSGDLC